MAGLLDLPDELVLSIVQFVANDPPKTSRGCGEFAHNYHRAIYPLVRVNQRLWRIALPVLYQQIDTGGFTNDIRQTCALIKTLISSRQKSAMVRELSIPPPATILSGTTKFSFEDRSKDFPEEEKAKRAALTSLHSNDTDYIMSVIDRAFSDDPKQRAKWMKNSCDTHEVGHVTAIALVGLCSLAKLTLMGDVDNMIIKLGELMDGLSDQARISAMQAPLTLLRIVMVRGCRWAKYPEATLPLGVVARWPNVTSLRAKNIGDRGLPTPGGEFWFEETEFDKIRARSSNLTELHIRPNAKISVPRFQKILSAPKALESFDYELGNGWAWVHVISSDVHSALIQQQQSLRSITFHDVYTQSFPKEPWPALSFASFVQLQELDISAYLLWGGDLTNDEADPSTFGDHIGKALPESLRSFSISRCWSFMCTKAAASAVATIVRLKSTKFSKIRKLVVAFTDPPPPAEAMQMPESEVAARAVGIELNVKTRT